MTQMLFEESQRIYWS